MTRATTAGQRRSLQGFTSVLLFLMPVVASLGSVVSIGGFAAARPLAAVLVVVTFLVTPRWNRVSIWIVVLIVCWLVWGLVMPHGTDAFKRLLSIALSLASVLAFVLYPWTRERLRLLGRAWLFAWIVAVIPAIYEIVSGKHLPNYLSSSPGWVRESSDDIASYFVNPNPFAYFLCAAMAVFIMASRLEKRWVRNVMLVCCALSPVIIYPTNSRLVLAVSLVMLVWMVATREVVRPRLKLLTAVSVTLVMVAVVVLISSPAIMNRIFNSFEGSGSDRLKLYMNAIWMFLSTFGLGIGPGMFENTMRRNRVPYITHEAVNPHSGVFEILSQYGFLIAALVGAALIAVAWRGMRGLGRIDEAPEYRMIRQGVVITAIMIPVLSFGDSTFLDSPIAWIQVATLLGFYCAYRQIARPVPKWARDGDPEVPERFRVVRRTLAADRRDDEPVAVPAG
ncbi:O-antigen ligase family protein [Arachnia propionica]|uniref:Lipid A core - O-antigen ligase and related enzymes n=1 Tax=Arachnia propionica TaxID=1750 RepID=A0A3S4Y0Q1_9ACTN|nr:O-antigen ligase family protein [Arachnia propionica]VEH71631.1 Lipid A core - O-antigen ligase and related enzymes [Arachnia propionica]